MTAPIWQLEDFEDGVWRAQWVVTFLPEQLLIALLLLNDPADADAQLVDFAADRGPGDPQAFGGFGLITVALFQHFRQELALDLFDNVVVKGRRTASKVSLNLPTFSRPSQLICLSV